MLWFYFRNSILDNAIDIWKNAEIAIQGDIIDGKNLEKTK